jgi:hypothetical protein
MTFPMIVETELVFPVIFINKSSVLVVGEQSTVISWLAFTNNVV